MSSTAGRYLLDLPSPGFSSFHYTPLLLQLSPRHSPPLPPPPSLPHQTPSLPLPSLPYFLLPPLNPLSLLPVPSFHLPFPFPFSPLPILPSLLSSSASPFLIPTFRAFLPSLLTFPFLSLTPSLPLPYLFPSLHPYSNFPCLPSLPRSSLFIPKTSLSSRGR